MRHESTTNPANRNPQRQPLVVVVSGGFLSVGYCPWGVCPAIMRYKHHNQVMCIKELNSELRGSRCAEMYH